MDKKLNQFIDDAIEESEEEVPKTKRQKLEHDEEMKEESIFSVPTIPLDRHRMAMIKELKILIRNNPQVSLKKSNLLHLKLNQMKTEELEMVLENIRIQLGNIKPNETASSILGCVGMAMENRLGPSYKGLSKNLVDDAELTAALDVYMPSFLDKMSLPLKIAYKIADHISKFSFGTDTFSTVAESMDIEKNQNIDGRKRKRSRTTLETPIQSTGDREMSDGEDDSISEADSA